MKNIFKKILLSLAVIVSSLFFAGNTAMADGAEKIGNVTVNVYFFHGETCAHCKKQKEYLADLNSKYNISIKPFEVYYSKQNSELMNRFAKAYNTSFNGVPVTIVGYEYVIGENYDTVEKLIKQYGAQSETIDPYQILLDYEKNLVVDERVKEAKIGSDSKTNQCTGSCTGDENYNGSDVKDVSVFGKNINIKKVGPVIFGIILGLTDGINPCMFGVLIFLLTYLISIGSKKKVLVSGIVFVITTFIFYFLIMLGMHNLLFNVAMFIPYISTFKIIIGCVAIVLGLIEVKDFFFYGKGFSLKIPAKMKPVIESIGRKGTYFSAFILAIFSSLVELPCTIGIPLTYIAAAEKSMNIFVSLLIYNIAFIIPLIVIITIVYKTSDKVKEGNGIKMDNKNYKRIMRLVAGAALLIMGILLILRKM